MAIRYAVAAGSIDDPTRWDGGTLPAPGDDVYLNNFAMTALAGSDIDWLSLNSSSNVSPAITAGGTLTISAARNFIITTINPRTDAGISNGLIQITASSGTVSITGNAQAGGAGSTSFCINRTGNCSFVFNGTVTPRAGSAAYVINLAGTGTVTMGSSGTPLTLPAALTNMIQINNASIVANIWADQFRGGTSGNCLVVTIGSQVNTFGDCIGGPASGRTGISYSGAGNHKHVGDCYAGTGGSTPSGISKGGACTLTINGRLISSPTFGVGNAVVSLSGTLILNDDIPRTIELGPVAPLSFSNSSTNVTLNISSVVRNTQSNVTAMTLAAITGTVNFSNPVSGGTAGSSATVAIVSGTCTINAPLISGGGISNCPGLSITAAAGTQTINADLKGANFTGANGVNVTGVGSIIIVNGKVTGNDYGFDGAVAGPAVGVSVTNRSTVYVREVESGLRGQCGIIGPVLMLVSPLNKATYRQSTSGPTTELVPPTGGSPNQYTYGYVT